jgi:hypothetical protein
VQAVSSFQQLLEEIPVVIRNPGIVSALLFDMQYDSKVREHHTKKARNFIGREDRTLPSAGSVDNCVEHRCTPLNHSSDVSVWCVLV